MPYIGAGIQRFNTADGLTVNGNAEVTGTTALTGNATAAGTLDVTGAVTADAGVSVDNITIDGTEIDLSSGNLTIDVAGDINLDADGGDVNFKDGGTSIGYLSNSSGTLLLGVNTSDADFKVQGNDGGSTINALTLDMSDAGAATFNGVVKVPDGSESAPAIVFSDDTNTGIYSSAADKICFSTGGTERMRITDLGRIEFEVPTNQSGGLQDQRLDWRNENNAGIMASIAVHREADANAPGALVFRTSNDVDSASNSSDGEISEKMRINSAGAVLVGLTIPLFSQTIGLHTSSASAGSTAHFNRTGDGGLVRFGSDATEEGSISVSGTTVSYNGGHLSRWSQATDGNRIDGLVKGTVMTNLDQMAVWHHEAQEATYYESGDDLLITPDICYKKGDTIPEGKKIGDLKTAAVYAKIGDEKTPATDAYNEDNEQLNCMAVSSVEGDVNVAGVFVNWDDDAVFTADMNIAMTGDMVIRIAQGTTVARGDLLMSAGDGTAKPQGDDIVRSKTIAKVTSTTKSHTYDDGSYLVPCVLMAC